MSSLSIEPINDHKLCAILGQKGLVGPKGQKGQKGIRGITGIQGKILDNGTSSILICKTNCGS